MCVYIYIPICNIRRPPLARGHQAAEDIGLSNMSYNPCQQHILQPHVILQFLPSLSAFSLQISYLTASSKLEDGCYSPHGSTFLPPSGRGRWILVPASQTIEFHEIPRNSQYPQKSSKWCLETSKALQNEVSRAAWNHQNQENIRKVKSNENHAIYDVFERLGHQKSTDFPIKNHSESCLQSKHAFWRLRSHKI